MTDEKYEITPMSESDLDEVIRIGLITKQLQIDDGEAMYYSKESLQRAIQSPNEVCLVVKVQGVLAGFFIAHINEVFEEAYISDISLKEEFRGMGLGQLLFTKAREILSGRHIDWSWALVQEENEAMHYFMKKQGYRKGKKFFFFYKPTGF